MPIVDLRSDTVTQPTEGMRRAMALADVGDDMFEEDPTVRRLEARVAELLGHEASLFVPSGTMANLIAVRLHCRPGEELLADADAHVLNYEQGGYAQVNGVIARWTEGLRGILTAEHFAAMLRPPNVHFPRARLVWLENTHNRGGGTVFPFEHVQAISHWAREAGLAVHIDGARLLNAVAATGIPAAQWGRQVDTVSLCFSKGLGAPVGSALAGPKASIAEARRHRKAYGGAMRQVGVLAAAALYALDHHVERLVEDHAHAEQLADGIRAIDGLALKYDTIDTNMVFFHVPPGTDATAFCEQLATHRVRMLPTAPDTIRAVANLDVDADGITRAIDALAATVKQMA